jgi:hypothetical protein
VALVREWNGMKRRITTFFYLHQSFMVIVLQVFLYFSRETKVFVSVFGVVTACGQHSGIRVKEDRKGEAKSKNLRGELFGGVAQFMKISQIWQK